MCRHINVARAKSDKTAWIVQLFSGESTSVDSSSAKPPSSAAPVSCEQVFYTGWCRESKNAWRANTSDKRCAKGWALKVDYQQGGADDESQMALFADGSALKVSGITIGHMKASKAVKIYTKGPLWEGVGYDGRRLRICKMADRGLLLGLFEENQHGKFEMACMAKAIGLFIHACVNIGIHTYTYACMCVCECKYTRICVQVCANLTVCGLISLYTYVNVRIDI